ncbi:glyoxalase/bleomycin resistance/extradiol dioxygenase family protein [Parasphingopyxis algicola]|uniref:VOC family protein n=1 Tax=Parasphingopyxis algicola TaxID=2026624 RepID=UPI0015A40070|nr:VOC family protein [Parasphingopyxis algicola]QLC24853.1 glyoxalase/bleomycin resistance/extradiol dioxygenase family protein [Parasphingopyxis algicola]
MIIKRLDHVNIFTDRLAATAQFYAELLDLEQRNGPPPSTPDNVLWMYDHSDQAILHLNSLDEPPGYERAYNREVKPGSETGAIHHVAFLCGEFDEVKSRLDQRGAEYEIRDIPSVGLRQIFTADPNNVLLELNFFDA